MVRRSSSTSGRSGASRRCFLLPASLDPAVFLDPSRRPHRDDDARWFVSEIFSKEVIGDVDEQGYACLRAQFLKRIMRSSDYKAVIGDLLASGVVERGQYEVGVHPFQYRISERFDDDNFIRPPITDDRLLRRLKKLGDELATERLRRAKPVHIALAELQSQLEIRGDEAREILSRRPGEARRYVTQRVLIDRIERKEFWWSIGRFGRMSNNISSLFKEGRTTLHVNGESLGSVDLTNSQPAFLAKLIEDERAEKAGATAGEAERAAITRSYDSRLAPPVNYDSCFAPLADDFFFYRELVQTGQFYVFMATRLQELGLPDEELKRLILRDVFAKHGTYPSKVTDCFVSQFPSVVTFIERVNRNGREHANLIRWLQQVEAEFVIETVAADLVTRYPGVFFITLHDAIFTTVGHLPKVEQAFQRAFAESGFPMTLKIKIEGSKTQSVIRPELRESRLAAGLKLHSNSARA